MENTYIGINLKYYCQYHCFIYFNLFFEIYTTFLKSAFFVFELQWISLYGSSKKIKFLNIGISGKGKWKKMSEKTEMPIEVRMAHFYVSLKSPDSYSLWHVSLWDRRLHTISASKSPCLSTKLTRSGGVWAQSFFSQQESNLVFL